MILSFGAFGGINFVEEFYMENNPKPSRVFEGDTSGEDALKSYYESFVYDPPPDLPKAYALFLELSGLY